MLNARGFSRLLLISVLVTLYRCLKGCGVNFVNTNVFETGRCISRLQIGLTRVRLMTLSQGHMLTKVGRRNGTLPLLHCHIHQCRTRMSPSTFLPSTGSPGSLSEPKQIFRTHKKTFLLCML